MELTNEIKQNIITAIKENRENYPSDNKHAAALGISSSVYNSLKKGKIDRMVSFLSGRRTSDSSLSGGTAFSTQCA